MPSTGDRSGGAGGLRKARILGLLRAANAQRQLGLLIGLALIVIVLSFLSPHFATFRNFLAVIRQISIMSIFAIGMTVVILCGEIDLSIGSTISFTGLLLAGTMSRYGIFPAIVVCLAAGTLVGVVNGVLVTRAKMPSFIATLSMMLIASGAGLIYCKGSPIVGVATGFRELGSGFILGIPTPTVIFPIVLGASWYLLRHMALGRHVYAIGGNAEAARLCGINVGRVKMFVFSLMGFLASFGAMVLTARINAAAAFMGSGYELDAIAAAVVGGTRLTGGVGGLAGTILGVAVLCTIDNGLNLLGVPSDFKYVAKGLIVIGALLTQVPSGGAALRRRHVPAPAPAPARDKECA